MEEVKAFASASSIVQEVLQNIRTVTAFHGQEKEEKRFRILPIFFYFTLVFFYYYHRFANNLLQSKTIAIKKGIYVGLCQTVGTIINYVGFAIIVW